MSSVTSPSAVVSPNNDDTADLRISITQDETKSFGSEQPEQEHHKPKFLPDLPVTLRVGDEETDEKEQKDATDKYTPQFTLRHDIYTLLFTAPFRITSHAFLYSVFFCLFQFVIIALTLADLLKDGTEGNRLDIPPSVDIVVSISQFLALFICVLTQDGVTTTLYLLSIGYDPDQVPPTSTKAKWMLSNFLRFALGMSMIFLCFVFIVQSTGVIQLFKDFAGIAFVSHIGDAAFQFARMGFVTDKLRKATQELRQVHFPEQNDTVSISTKKSLCTCGGETRCRVKRRQLCLLIVYGTLVGIWSWLFSRQRSGDFLIPSIEVQFGDETYGNLQYSYFSGVYELSRHERVARRGVYYERGDTSGSSSGKFFYCSDEEAWVFSIENVTTDKDKHDGCRWLYRSPRTNAYDLGALQSFNDWKVWTGRVQDAENFELSGSACSSKSDCNYHGICQRGICVCDYGWLGKFCGFEDIFCDDIVFYLDGELIQGFTVLRNRNSEPVIVYERPVYYGLDSKGEDLIAIIYTGRRWFISEWGSEQEAEALLLLLTQPFFHAQWSNVYTKHTVVFSEPTNGFLPVGDEVKWRTIGSSTAKGDFGTFGFWKAIPASMHCQNVDCSISQVCGKFGVCQNNSCLCNDGRAGHFCEYPFYADIAAVNDTDPNWNGEL